MANELQKKILNAVPEAVVRGAVGRESSFEIIINDEEVFSKLKVGKFPNFDEVVDVVKAVHEGKEVREVIGTESCVIM
ncbi:migration and invasion enhancer 1-like [Stegodyphus dumicola]|uniref:migration and invasion enhancer 1-like n=1 Tax=Stegodyphus dumicola TaxID=202533 RepID=UPI0015ACF97F|nr:migration and invasion enhancer 1-like [Stegodyphus dumicola]